MNKEKAGEQHSAPDAGAALSHAIGARVRQVRNALSLTLDQLAERSDVSKRMLINIEKGVANPSMVILLRIGDALGIGLPALVAQPRIEPMRITQSGSGAILWRGDHGGTAVLVAGTRAPNVVELWQWTLAPGDERVSSGHNTNTIELLQVVQGVVTVTVDDQIVTLAQGDAIDFDADRKHAYTNAGDVDAVFSMVVYEPVSTDLPARIDLLP